MDQFKVSYTVFEVYMLCTNVPGWCTLYEYVNLFCDIIDILSKRWLKREREREREKKKRKKKKRPDQSKYRIKAFQTIYTQSKKSNYMFDD